MGRTPKPLHFLIHPALATAPEVLALAEKGHTVTVDTTRDYCPGCHHLGMGEYDLLLAPNAWKMDARLIKYLDLAVKAARAIKYPKKEKKT